ncbi:MAG: ribbon-helix-helix protein, CopG family [Epsilonproteobacteria bacterium]|nr:ribbon-helix-helix protein, CopG family [Campylobacterota bacterium]
MHRTQIYFEESLFEALKQEAKAMGISVSAFIREVLREDLKRRKKEPKKRDFREFGGMWANRDVSKEKLREKAWKRSSATPTSS